MSQAVSSKSMFSLSDNISFPTLHLAWSYERVIVLFSGEWPFVFSKRAFKLTGSRSILILTSSRLHMFMKGLKTYYPTDIVIHMSNNRSQLNVFKLCRLLKNTRCLVKMQTCNLCSIRCMHFKLKQLVVGHGAYLDLWIGYKQAR